MSEFDMEQPLSIKKVRDYVDLKQYTQLSTCLEMVNTRPDSIILDMGIDYFEYIRKYATKNIEDIDLQNRILGATVSFFRLVDPFNYPEKIAQGIAGLMILKELLEYEEERGNEK